MQEEESMHGKGTGYEMWGMQGYKQDIRPGHFGKRGER
jgi:hypothetical protein